jgi:hypothetical protein
MILRILFLTTLLLLALACGGGGGGGEVKGVESISDFGVELKGEFDAGGLAKSNLRQGPSQLVTYDLALLDGRRLQSMTSSDGKYRFLGVGVGLHYIVRALRSDGSRLEALTAKIERKTQQDINLDTMVILTVMRLSFGEQLDRVKDLSLTRLQTQSLVSLGSPMITAVSDTIKIVLSAGHSIDIGSNLSPESLLTGRPTLSLADIDKLQQDILSTSPVTDPPVAVTDPPVAVTDPPVAVTDPPVAVTDPPVVTPPVVDPPVVTPPVVDPPVVTPPVVDPPVVTPPVVDPPVVTPPVVDPPVVTPPVVDPPVVTPPVVDPPVVTPPVVDPPVVTPSLNRAPTAIISDGGLVRSGANLLLSATSSSDPDGDSLSYIWTQTSGNLAIFSANAQGSTYVSLPLLAGDYRFQVEVSDGKGAGNTATVDFTAYDVVDFKDQLSHPILVPYLDKLNFEIETIPSSNNFNLHWNQVKGAHSYEFIFGINGGSSSVATSIYGFSFGHNHLHFQYDETVPGYSFSDNIYRSSFVRTGPIFTFQVKAYSGASQTGTLLDQSESLKFKPGQILPKAPAQVRVVSGNTSARVHWSSVSEAKSYLVNYLISGNTKAQQVQISGGNLFADLDLQQGEISGNILALGTSGNSFPSLPFRAAALETVDLSIAAVTLNQSVQIDVSTGTNTAIPLIAGKATILRVFPFLSGNTQPRQVVVSLCGNLLGGNVMERISKEAVVGSSNIGAHSETMQPVLFDLPTSWLVAGASFYIDLDLLNELEESNESNNRFPALGTQVFGFQAQPSLKIKLVPVKTVYGNTSITDNVIASMKTYLSAMYPNNQLEFTVHSNVLDVSSGAFSWDTTLSKLNVLRDNEVTNATKDVFYYGLLQSVATSSYDQFSGTAGLAYRTSSNNMTSASTQLSGIGESHEAFRNSTFAHEVGHMHGRQHVNNTDEFNDSWVQPADTDANYPYNSPNHEYGRIGHLGFDVANRRLLSGELYHDIMSYCSTVWISDYTYKALASFQTSLHQHIQSLSLSKPSLLASMSPGVWVSGTIKDGIWSITGLSYGDSSVHASGAYMARIEVGTDIIESLFDNIEVCGGSSSAFRFFVPSQERIKALTISSFQSGGIAVLRQVSDIQADRIESRLFENLYQNSWTLAATYSDQRIVKASKDGGVTWTVICYDGDDQAFNLVIDQSMLIDIVRVKRLFINKTSQKLLLQ